MYNSSIRIYFYFGYLLFITPGTRECSLHYNLVAAVGCGVNCHSTSHAPKALPLLPPTTLIYAFFVLFQAHTRPAAVMVGGLADWSTILLTRGKREDCSELSFTTSPPPLLDWPTLRLFGRWRVWACHDAARGAANPAFPPTLGR